MKLDIELPENRDDLRVFLGPADRHIQRLRESLQIDLWVRGNRLRLESEDEGALQRANIIIERLLTTIEDGAASVSEELERFVDLALEELNGTPDTEIRTGRRRIELKTPGQVEYVSNIRNNPLTIAAGPAGTGKTYLAVACAIEALRLGHVRRLVLTRPAVEAGEKLGFLPGDLRDKVNPYLRPIYDALDDMLPRRQFHLYLTDSIIEVAPLAFMRGRTLNRSFIILDEAQNTTPQQMKMFLTRLGPYSKAVVTGDETQGDLPDQSENGLTHALHLLANVPEIAVTYLNRDDIVRHRLVSRIIAAYESAGT